MGKLRDWLVARVSSAVSAIKNRRPRIVSGAISDVEMFSGWMVPVVLLGLAAGSLLFGRVDWMFLWIALDALFLKFFLREIREPDQAYVFRFGKVIGRVGPGWYIAIPHFTDLEPLNREVFNIEFDKIRMYTGAGTEVMINFIATFQIDETEEAIKKALELGPEEREPLFRHMTLSKLSTAIGFEDDFLSFNKRQREVEKKVLGYLQEEAEKYGYTAKEVEVYIIEETVVTEAERIKILGQARGEEAKAISEPLKDNWPAAMVATANMVFGQQVREIKKAAGSKKGVKAVSDAMGAVGKAVGAVKDALGGSDGGADDAAAK